MLLQARDLRMAFGGVQALDGMSFEVAQGAAVGLSWQLAFHFPCQHQPVISNGISEPISYAVQWSATPFQMLTIEGSWHPWRGGLFGQVPRSQSMTLLTARFRDFPDLKGTQVYRMTAPYPTNQFRLTTTKTTQLGL